MSLSDVKKLQDALAEVSKKSATDPDFRSLALRDASAAIAKVSTSPLPADLSIKFVDNSGSVKTIVLPDPVSADSLSDFELEDVAGGVAAAPDTLSAGAQWSRAGAL